jgi:hypothetical protein
MQPRGLPVLLIKLRNRLELRCRGERHQGHRAVARERQHLLAIGQQLQQRRSRIILDIMAIYTRNAKGMPVANGQDAQPSPRDGQRITHTLTKSSDHKAIHSRRVGNLAWGKLPQPDVLRVYKHSILCNHVTLRNVIHCHRIHLAPMDTKGRRYSSPCGVSSRSGVQTTTKGSAMPVYHAFNTGPYRATFTQRIHKPNTQQAHERGRDAARHVILHYMRHPVALIQERAVERRVRWSH